MKIVVSQAKRNPLASRAVSDMGRTPSLKSISAHV
jgi:hypothetical protein